MSYIQQIIGNNIKNLRKSKNLSRELLAEKISISYQYLSQIEAGKNFLKAETFEKLCEALEITPAQLVSIDSDLPLQIDDKDSIKPLLHQIIRNFDSKKAESLYKLITAFIDATEK